jgi:DNA-binding SARP family transcriptional activator
MTNALPRERLETLLASAVLAHRFSLVVAPAGSGKTTLLARFVGSIDVPVGWYRAESWDDDERGLLRHIEAALTPALPGLATGWRRVEDAAAALDAWTGGRALLIVDDLHALEGTAAEAALGRLVDYAPPWLSFLAATRVLPGFNLSRLRVSGELLEINGDDLRFRAWEVERLFRDFYADPVPPSDLAVLARRTEGWAAGLQLFHLATRGKSADERKRILGLVGSSTRLVREYLARNVLAELPDEVRRFLVDTCVLGRLTGDLCDRLLERNGSGKVLDDLARRQIFTVTIDEDEGSYRYHEVLRAHLDRVLVEEIGEAEARTRHARAGVLLENDGALAEALAAYCRADDWPAVRRLLGDRGEQVAGGHDLRLEALPPALIRHDPWLALASARRARADGRWAAALDEYGRAETAFGPAPTVTVCRQERLVLTAWLQPVAIPPAGWSGVLRSGLVREPIGAARGVGIPSDSHRDVVRGLLLLAAGEVRDARRVLGDAADTEGLERSLAIASRLAAGVAGLLAGDTSAVSDVDAAVEAAERDNLTWLARAGRIVGRLGGRATADADRAAEAYATEGDEWGGALAALAEAWAPGRLVGGRADETDDPADSRISAAERAASLFRRLGAGVLEAWARALGAYGQAEAGTVDARESALTAESFARAAGAPGPRLLAYAALARADEGRSADYERLVATAWQDTGLVLPPTSGPAEEVAFLDRPNPLDADPVGDGRGAVASVAPAVRIRTFGTFALEIDGRQIPLQAVRPRARAVLRFLALNVGTAVHREVIQEALWPEADRQRGGRSLHVAISAMRGLLVQALGLAGQRLIVREGDAYRLAVDPLAVDIGRFEQAMAEGRAGRPRGDQPSGFALAIQVHRGELLPQDGPAEWVVERREHYRREAVEAARSEAEYALIAGDLDAVVQFCRAGLELDRYHDPLWRLLIAAHDRAGDAGAAGRDRLEYEAILAGLGVSVEAAVGSA